MAIKKKRGKNGNKIQSDIRWIDDFLSAFRYCENLLLGLLVTLLSRECIVSVFACIEAWFGSAELSQCSEVEVDRIVGDLQISLLSAVIVVLICVTMVHGIFGFIAKKDENAKNRQICSLEKELSKRKIDEESYNVMSAGVGALIRMYVGTVAKRCNITPQERISFYVLEQDGETLSILARYAKHQDYKLVLRETYKIRSGIISKARNEISALEENLPDFEKYPDKYYVECKKKFSMNKMSVQALSMKARFYYAFRFSSIDGQDFNSILVIESMRGHFKEKWELDEIFKSDNDFIYSVVKSFHAKLPRLKASNRRKF